MLASELPVLPAQCNVITSSATKQRKFVFVLNNSCGDFNIDENITIAAEHPTHRKSNVNMSHKTRHGKVTAGPKDVANAIYSSSLR